jgi:predicted dehydrogenase
MSAARPDGARWRVGIVGVGFGANVHLPAFRAQGSFDVVAIASPNRAAQVGRERNVAAFDSLEQMLDGVELDVVSIATPPRDHRRLALQALQRGKNVLCEKPFARTVAEAEEMLAALERAGTVGAIAHEFRYTSSRLALRELIVNGHLGPLREIEYTVLYRFLRAHAERRNNWWFRREHGGGLAGAIMSHEIDTVTWLAGRLPVRATGLSRTANVERIHEGERFRSEVDDGAFALIDYGDGLVARVTVDGTRAVESSTLAVHGEDRTAVVGGDSMLGGSMYVVDADETSELTLKAEPHANLTSVHPNVPAFVALLDEFAEALAGKPADLPTFAQGVATQRVLAAVGYEDP